MLLFEIIGTNTLSNQTYPANIKIAYCFVKDCRNFALFAVACFKILLNLANLVNNLLCTANHNYGCTKSWFRVESCYHRYSIYKV